MTRSSRTPRPLTIGDETFLWTVRHEHTVPEPAGGYEDCREVLTIRRPNALGCLRITFTRGPGHLVPDTHAPAGAVGMPDGSWLDLHDPGTVRDLLEEARHRGLGADGAAAEEADGWVLFGPVAARRGAVTEQGR